MKHNARIIEVMQDDELYEFLPYPRHLRYIEELDNYGVIYENKVYPIIKSFYEKEDGSREEIILEINEI